MEIRAYAEQVLFAESLADKLVSPPRWTDDAPGPAIRLPDSPTRPSGLRFEDMRAREPMPRMRELADPAARAVLLHAFANHELLAMELMALFLLRCPEAPPAFRRGLAHILSEEQIHFRLYLDRLAALGLEFGSLPVNRFLWDCVAGAAEVEDFTARMGLTFEAANLDHALDFGAALREAGDPESAAVLDRVYQDEIRHVQHARFWFQRELPEGADLWSAWTGRLMMPLNPERAKGRTLSVEARRAVGLPEDFIEKLALYACSKGRAPTVRLFNPDAERQVASGDPALKTEGPFAALAADLDLLPAQLCSRDDVVIVRRPPRPAFLRQLQQGGLTLPQLVVAPDLQRLDQTELAGRKLSAVEPWGWSPASAAWLAPLTTQISGPAAAGWTADRRPLYTKGLAATLLREFLTLQQDDGLCSLDDAGTLCADRAQVEAAVASVLDAGHRRALLKAPFGTAGRGARRVAALQDLDARWLDEALSDDAPVVVQPWLDRLLDLSFHLDVGPDGRGRFRGTTRFFTTPAGRYLGTWVGTSFGPVTQEITRFLHGQGRDRRWLNRVSEAVCALVGAEAAARGHRGPLGIDAFVYRQGGALRLQPLVEINPRVTMGRVGLALRDRVASQRAALFVVMSRGDLKQTGYKSFLEWSETREPVDCEGARVRQGVWFLTDPQPATDFCAALAVGEDLAHCARLLGQPEPGSSGSSERT